MFLPNPLHNPTVVSERQHVQNVTCPATLHASTASEKNGDDSKDAYPKLPTLQEFQKRLEDSVSKIQGFSDSEVPNCFRRLCPGGGDSEDICFRASSSDCTLTPSVLEHNLDDVVSEDKIQVEDYLGVSNTSRSSSLCPGLSDLSSWVDMDSEFAGGHDPKPYVGSLRFSLDHPWSVAIPWTHQIPSFPEKMLRWQTWNSEEMISSLSRVVIPTAICAMIFTFFRKQMQ